MQCHQKHTPQTSPNVSKPNNFFRMEKLEKLCLLLISENASSPPGQKLVVGTNPILPLFDIANTAFASKHRHRIWRSEYFQEKTRRREFVCKVTKAIGKLGHFVRNDPTTFNNYLIATILFKS